MINSFNFFASAFVVEQIYGDLYISEWSLYDGGGHVDWKDDGSIYINNFIDGVENWEKYENRSGTIRKDTWATICDVVVSDYNEESNVNAYCSSDGKIKFNKYNMKNYSGLVKSAIATHEIGHALGLDDNDNQGSIMYRATPLMSKPANIDLCAYDYAYDYHTY